jgi:RNA polymerase sigma factor (TIGR02999 family)
VRIALTAAAPDRIILPNLPNSSMEPTTDITQALVELSEGNRAALDRLLPLVYDELRRMAERELRRERGDHTLSPTALVHEAYLRLVQLDRISWRGRAHFYGACAQVMRRVLISYARMKKAEKRGGAEAQAVPIENVMVVAEERPEQLVALDEALERLATLNPRHARVVECRFFAGMDVDQTAEALGVARATVKRDWAAARAWLNRELNVQQPTS